MIVSKFRALSGASLAALLISTGIATAGGFAVREQSAYYQGTSFAGMAAGDELSSIFWNPAALANFRGIQTSTTLSGIFGHANNQPLPGAVLLPFGPSGNIATPAVVPASYYSYQFSEQVFLGLAVNAPFGLAVNPRDIWAGMQYARQTDLRTYNFNPMIAYRINDQLSIGAGVQFQYARASFDSAANLAGTLNGHLLAKGWGYGFTLGVLYQPTPWTSIGLGWRSGVDQKASGVFDIQGPGGIVAATGPASATLKLPDTVTLSLSQRITENFKILASVEWSNWSRIGTTIVQVDGPLPNLALPFRYRDGWFAALGGEYQYDERTAFRAGVAYERTPIKDEERTPRLPDSDRIWASIGATYAVTRNLKLDIGYSHIFGQKVTSTITAASGNPWFNGIPYVGEVKPSVDIVSVGLRYKFDAEPAPVAPRVYK